MKNKFRVMKFLDENIYQTYLIQITEGSLPDPNACFKEEGSGRKWEYIAVDFQSVEMLLKNQYTINCKPLETAQIMKEDTMCEFY